MGDRLSYDGLIYANRYTNALFGGVLHRSGGFVSHPRQ